ncbi:MAG: flippase-like domain-containing protein [Gemmataceae bacterium]|nr:flippase-like domain-containing protein [Gemmataceae bacterium]MDW8266473.1 lysylphosphatidylglycerol synthase transmembrane domain-containing protein [Gemmataceae bacterium]
MTRHHLWTAAKYAVGLGLLSWVVAKNWHGLEEAFQRPIHWGPFALALTLFSLAVALTFVRWFVLVRAQELPFTVGQAIRLGWVGLFWSTFLPGSIGGDIFKAVFLAREQSRRTVAVATVLFDRIIGLWGLFWLVGLLGALFWLIGDPAVLASANLRWVVGTALTVVAGSLAAWTGLGLLPDRRANRLAHRLSLLPKVGPSLAEAWRAAWMYRRKGRQVFLALGLSLVAQVGFVCTFYLSARTLLEPDVVPSLREHFLVVPIGMVVQALSPTPGGVGIGELSFGGLYLLLGREAKLGEIGSLVQRVITWVVGLVGYMVYLQAKPAWTSADAKLDMPVMADEAS